MTEAEGRDGGHGEGADSEEDVDGHRASVDGSVQQDHVRQDQVRQGGVQERLGAQVQQAQGRLGPKAGQAEEAPAKEKTHFNDRLRSVLLTRVVSLRYESP